MGDCGAFDDHRDSPYPLHVDADVGYATGCGQGGAGGVGVARAPSPAKSRLCDTEMDSPPEELIVAFNLYCKIPFGRISHSNSKRRPIFPEGKTRETMIRTRVNQGFFRAAVLAAYGSSCCITGCSVAELLNASHIVPWAVDVKNRTNPRNGLCLNAIHDRAFDCGLLTVMASLEVKISTRAKRKSSDVGTHELLLRYEGASISLPRRFAPDPEFLKYHNEHIFLRS